MRRIIAAPAKRDIAAVLGWSHERFGAEARARYERLIARGLMALTVPSDPPGSRELVEVGASIRIYHLRHCRRAADGPPVRDPRHFLIYERPSPDLVVVLRLLHDAMDLPTHLRERD